MKGSVAKRCTCRPVRDASGKRKTCPKKHGSWSYTADVGIDPATDKRKQVRRGGFPTREAAEEALAVLLQQVREHGWADDQGRTVTAWLTDWLNRQERSGELRPSTLTMYRSYVDGRINDHLGRIRLRDLRRPAVAQMVHALVEAGDGATTIHRVVAALRSGLTAAVRAGLIPRNPARDIDLPRRSIEQPMPWEPLELAAFLDHAATDRLGILFEVLAMTGLRRGEALGLRWDDLNLDPDGPRITVRRQIVQGATTACTWCQQPHAVAWREPKTAAGERIVDIGRQTAGALLGHRLVQDAERAQWGSAYVEHGLVFAREDGQPIYPTTVTHRFGQLAAQTTVTGPDGATQPLRPVKLHDLRHGAASLGIAAGVPIEVISKRLGHSSIEVTVDIYGHLLEGVGHRAAEATVALVPRTRPAGGVPRPV